jgi:hypothetical protein
MAAELESDPPRPQLLAKIFPYLLLPTIVRNRHFGPMLREPAGCPKSGNSQAHDQNFFPVYGQISNGHEISPLMVGVVSRFFLRPEHPEFL